MKKREKYWQKSLLTVFALVFTGMIFCSNTMDNRPVRSTIADNHTDSVMLTSDKSIVCGLTYIGKISVTEKKWFSYNSTLKEQTEKELKRQSAALGGNVVYIARDNSSGFGIFFTTEITGYVYKK